MSNLQLTEEVPTDPAKCSPFESSFEPPFKSSFKLLCDAANFVDELTKPTKSKKLMKMKQRQKLVGCLVKRNFIVHGLLITFQGVVFEQTGNRCHVYWPRDHTNTWENAANLTVVVAC